MKTSLQFIIALACISLFCSCAPSNSSNPKTINLKYWPNSLKRHDIDVSFDTLHNGNDTIRYKHNGSRVYSNGYLEQALAYCYDSANKETATQDVFSSMYMNPESNLYDCITNTTFHFVDGDIIASGIFHLVPGNDSLPPDHDFPIIGGSGSYANIYGTYTRRYRDTVFYVQLKYYSR